MSRAKAQFDPARPAEPFARRRSLHNGRDVSERELVAMCFWAFLTPAADRLQISRSAAASFGRG